jgi:hypothetical protein
VAVTAEINLSISLHIVKVITSLLNVCSKFFRWLPRILTVVTDKNFATRFQPFEEASEQSRLVL